MDRLGSWLATLVCGLRVRRDLVPPLVRPFEDLAVVVVGVLGVAGLVAVVLGGGLVSA